MKVSLVTVCFNSSKTIKSTIESVQNQSYDDLEYIIIDGGSTDNTLDIIQLYGETVTKLISERDDGLYHAMNKGISLATGDVIGFINSDDLFCDNNAIKKVVESFENNPNMNGVYADLFYVSKDDVNNVVRKWVSGIQKSFRSGWHPAHPTLYIKKGIYDKYGCFNLKYQIAADFEIMLRLIEKFNVNLFYLEEPLVKMRLGGESNKNFGNIIKQNIECLRAFKENNVKVNRLIYPFLRIIPKFRQFINNHK